jgi:uncharacterized protein HemY
MGSVCIDVDLGEFRTGELIDELRRRHALKREDLIELSPKAIVAMLEEFGCPQSIIKQLQEWANQPVVTIHKLVAWKEACE